MGSEWRGGEEKIMAGKMVQSSIFEFTQDQSDPGQKLSATLLNLTHKYVVVP